MLNDSLKMIMMTSFKRCLESVKSSLNVSNAAPYLTALNSDPINKILERRNMKSHLKATRCSAVDNKIWFQNLDTIKRQQ